MSSSPPTGWYPDPSGRPGRLRWWDGERWTAQTRPVDGPTGPPRATPQNPGRPGTGAEPSERRPRTSGIARWWPLLAAAVALGLVLVLLTVGFLLFRPRAQRVGTGEPSPTVSGWNETSTPSASPSPTGSERPAECDQPAADELPEPPADRRVHGGPLSVGVLSGWTGPRAENRVPLGRDAHGMGQRVKNETALAWESSVTLGVIADPTASDPEATASLLMRCLVTSDFYYSVDATLGDESSKAITVDGTPAAQVDAIVSFDDPRLRTKGSALRVVVVQTTPLTFCFSAVPKERDDLKKQIDQVTSGLRVD